MKKGVEDWKPRSRKAGFKNAIICRKPEPFRGPELGCGGRPLLGHSLGGRSDMNAMGPHVHDPRSGEIISAHIIFWHDIVKLTQLWYFRAMLAG